MKKESSHGAKWGLMGRAWWQAGGAGYQAQPDKCTNGQAGAEPGGWQGMQVARPAGGLGCQLLRGGVTWLDQSL